MKKMNLRSKVSLALCAGIILVAVAAEVVKSGTVTDTSTMTVKNMKVTSTNLPVLIERSKLIGELNIKVTKIHEDEQVVTEEIQATMPSPPPSPYFSSSVIPGEGKHLN